MRVKAGATTFDQRDQPFPTCCSADENISFPCKQLFSVGEKLPLAPVEASLLCQVPSLGGDGGSLWDHSDNVTV